MKPVSLLRKILFTFSLLAVWQALVTLFRVPAYLFPSPLEVASAWISHWRLILTNSAITFTEAFLGFFLANLISVGIAIVVSFFRSAEDLVMPLAIAIKTMPIIALAPLLVVWFGSGLSSKVAAAMLVCFFPALVNVLEGARNLDRKLLCLFRVFSASNFQLVGKLIIPGILPYLFAALKTSSSLAVVGALVGEFIGSNRGLGFIIMSNYYNMNTRLVFAAILTSNAIGISFYYFLSFLEGRTSFSEERLREVRNQGAPVPYRYLERR